MTQTKAALTFTCTQDNLQEGLARVVPITSRGGQLPILQYVLLRANAGVLELTATDLEIGVVTSVGGGLKGGGEVAVPARSVFSYIQQLPKTHPVEISVQKNTVRIETKNFSASFPLANSDDFPILPKSQAKKVAKLPAHVLCGGLQQVIFSAARDETRPEIRGVYVGGETSIQLAATDSFRLAEYSINGESINERSFVLPLTTAQEVIRIFEGQGDIEISLADNYIVFTSNETELTSRLIDGEYPNYQQIIPTKHTTKVVVNKDELIRSLKTLTVLLPPSSRRVGLVVDPDNSVITARVEGGGSAEGEVVVDVKGDGATTEVLMNIQYLIEGLQHINTADCEISLTSNTSPILIKPLKEEGFVYVVMPIRV